MLYLYRMEMEKPLVDKDYLLIRLGDWTIVEIPEIPMTKRPFGMLKVKGRIDHHEFVGVSLMPIGNGHLGLAVSAKIRKKIGKEVSDMVRVVLYVDESNTLLEIPEELISCLQLEEGVYEKFDALTNGMKKTIVDWIYLAKTEQTKAERIAKIIIKIQRGEKF